jgi:UDP-2,3-diacylglucosamine pyrophosphatase LpxH
MAALRYVCLSDLHLGAADSLLTHVDDNDVADTSVPGNVLKTLADGLRDIATRTGDGTPVTLILLGDALDMGLSHTRDAGSAFQQFLDALFPPDAPSPFSHDILFVPGNHDYILWEGSRHHRFMESFKSGSLPVDEVPATPLFGTPTMISPLLSALMHTRPQLADGTVHVAYPNMGLSKGDQTIILHHGHYIDAMYRPVSRLKRWIDKSAAPPSTVAELAENGPWIGFLWSNLGSAGNDATDAMTLYQAMLDAGASHELSALIADRVGGVLESDFGVLASDPVTHGVTVGQLVRGLIDLTVGRAAESQRTGYDSVLDSNELADLRWYLGGPVRAQLHEESVANDGRTSFIFGHTHKPFQDQIAVTSFSRPVAVYNTGGWVLDQPTLMPCQGGSAMLIDADLNIAALRLYNDPVNGDNQPVRVGGLAAMLDDNNPIYAAAVAAVAANKEEWTAFSTAIYLEIARRVRMRMKSLFDTPAGGN